MNSIDEKYYNNLADWAESDEPEIREPVSEPDIDRTETRDLLRHAEALDGS